MPGFLLLTGATGLIGQYLLQELLRDGDPVAVVVRPDLRHTARERTEQLVRTWDRDLGPQLSQLVCLEGDVSEQDLGLSGKAQRWVRRHCERMLHNAACVKLYGADRSREPWRSNLEGTRCVLDFCGKTGIGQLHWMSTAYVCGNRRGPVCEDELECGQGFRNDYERSKFEAERLVRRATFLDSCTIYRPSIVVGDSQTGYTTSYHNIYLYLQFTWILYQKACRDADGRWHFPIRLNLSGNEEANFVPVDWVGAAVSHVLRHSEWHGRTYHLTNPHPTTSREIEAAMARSFNFYGVEFVGTDGVSPDTMSDLEQLFYAEVAPHMSYWSQHPRFDRINTDFAMSQMACPEIDVPCLRRLFAFAMHNRFGRGTSPDGRAKKRASIPAARSVVPWVEEVG